LCFDAQTGGNGSERIEATGHATLMMFQEERPATFVVIAVGRRISEG
jgi:hypothetical protein